MFDTLERILIVKPSALGDIVHALPFLHALKQRFPEARIDWVVAHGLHAFLEDHPLIHKLWVIKKDQWKDMGRLARTLREIRDLRTGLKKAGYEVCVDLSGILRSGVITWFSRAPYKLGFKESDEGSPFFYTHKIHGSMSIHAIDRYLKIAEYLGCRTDEIVYPFAPYDPDPSILKGLPRSFAVMSPSAGKPANRWDAAKFGGLAARLPVPTVVIASGPESGIADEVVRHSKGKAVSIAGRTGLKDLLGVIGKARFFVCNDTGPMHMAAALSVPVFAVFGPANPIRTGPYGPIHTVVRKNLPCSPCYAHVPCRKYNHRCMADISVRDVFDPIARRMGFE